MGTARFETLVDFARRDLDIAVRCNGCRHTRFMTMAQAADVFGMGARVAEVQRRLRCTRCQGKGAQLTPIPKLPAA